MLQENCYKHRENCYMYGENAYKCCEKAYMLCENSNIPQEKVGKLKSGILHTQQVELLVS